jgi:hypothetical protein
MQYNIKVTVTKGVKDTEKKDRPSGVKTLQQFMVNKNFENEATVKEIKDFAKTTQIKNYTDEEINGAVLMLNGEPATDDNATVKVHTNMNYVLNLK